MQQPQQSTRSIVIGAALTMLSASALFAEPANDHIVRLRVMNEAGRLPGTNHHVLYLGSSANGWDPRGTASLAAEAEPGQPPSSWTFELPRSVIDQPGFAFKFTRGSWETVEVAADGRDTPNRSIPRIDWDASLQAGTMPVIEFTIEGFADQRGTRWPGPNDSTVVGTLEIHDFKSEILGNTRKVRIWLPEGYSKEEDPARSAGLPRYPVLYMHDGQNLFDARTSFAGEWRVDEALTQLIAEQRIAPTIVVGIDNSGTTRSDEYTPIPIGKRRPGTGGKADLYLRMVTDELMPWVNRTYRTQTGPDHTAIGGSSLGGVVSLYAAMSRPGVFGLVLAESPSFWVGENESGEPGEFLRMLQRFEGHWPQRIFMAMGDKEYNNAEDDARLVGAAREAEAAMRAMGLDDQRLRVEIEQGAPHNESAWAQRLPGALIFLFADR